MKFEKTKLGKGVEELTRMATEQNDTLFCIADVCGNTAITFTGSEKELSIGLATILHRSLGKNATPHETKIGNALLNALKAVLSTDSKEADGLAYCLREVVTGAERLRFGKDEKDEECKCKCNCKEEKEDGFNKMVDKVLDAIKEFAEGKEVRVTATKKKNKK